MQNLMTLGLIIKKVCDLFTVNYKYGKIIQCEKPLGPRQNIAIKKIIVDKGAMLREAYCQPLLFNSK